MLVKTFEIGMYISLGYFIMFSIIFMIKTITRTQKLYTYQKKQQLSNRLNHNYYVPISILLVTNNDEHKIEKTMKELLALDYKLYEIIIIDAGSIDQTVNKVIDVFNLQKIERPIRTQIKTEKIKEIYQTNKQKVKITLLKKKKEEIYDAINAGINAADYPYFININTSYHLANNALKQLVNPILEDDHIIISQGVSRMGDLDDEKIYHFPKKIWNKANVLDSNNKKVILGKEFNELADDQSFTLFQKETVIKCLGYDKSEAGYNFELIRKIRKSFSVKKEECVIKQVDDAICYIDDSKINIFKRIKKVQRSLFLSHKNYKRVVFNTKNKVKNFVSKFFFHYGQIYHPFINLIVFIFVIAAVIITKIDLKILLFFFGSYLLFYIFLSIYNFLAKLITEGNKLTIGLLFRMILVTLMQVSLYKMITNIIKITAVFGYKNNKT